MTAVIRQTQIEVHDPEQLPPYPRGLFAHVDWVQQDGIPRFLLNDGVIVRPRNFGGETSFGAWEAGWCADPDTIPADTLKEGVRPTFAEDRPFTHDVVFGADQNYVGNLREEERQETRDRALRALMRYEQVAAERQLAARMLADLTALGIATGTATSVVDALGQFEDIAAELAVGGLLIHGRPYYAVVEPSPFTASLETKVGGLQYVAGGGYVDGLQDVLVLTSPVLGWRGADEQNEVTKHEYNQFVAVAERSLLLGYEKIIAAVEIS
jgi:hypothetical protein